MGLIRVNVTLEGRRSSLRTVALVDTGATFSIIPEALADKLALPRTRSYTVTLADGRVQRLRATTVGIRLDGRAVPVTALVSTCDEMLLGAETLEVLEVSVDPKRRRLKYGKFYGLKAA